MKEVTPGRKRTREELWDAADEAALEADLAAQRGEYEEALRGLRTCPDDLPDQS